jgi:outer membrane protein OmpA-like peptidoglycan-associated protein
MKLNSFFTTSILLSLTGLIWFANSGCATKGFVEKKVLALDTRITNLSSQVEGLAADDVYIKEEITRLNQKAISKSLIAHQSVMFDFDSWQLPDQGKAVLEQIAQKLVSKKNLMVFIVGHTDSIGSETYNTFLGQRRAQAVATYLLTKLNIEPHKVHVETLGESLPKAPNDSPEGRRQNRRAEIFLVETTWK